MLDGLIRCQSSDADKTNDKMLTQRQHNDLIIQKLHAPQVYTNTTHTHTATSV